MADNAVRLELAKGKVRFERLGLLNTEVFYLVPALFPELSSPVHDQHLVAFFNKGPLNAVREGVPDYRQ